MLKHLKASGCEVPMSNVLCAPCDMSKAGGFTPDPGAVILCAGHFFSQQHMESTITHELMHMYDHCRFKVDWANLRHHACSEVSTSTFHCVPKCVLTSCQIRANNLSGDCRFTRELRRGFLSFSKQHQVRPSYIYVTRNKKLLKLLFFTFPPGLRTSAGCRVCYCESRMSK